MATTNRSNKEIMSILMYTSIRYDLLFLRYSPHETLQHSDRRVGKIDANKSINVYTIIRQQRVASSINKKGSKSQLADTHPLP